MRSLFLLALLGLLSAGVRAQDPGQLRWVKASPLLLREGADPQAPVRARLQQGSQVLLLGPDGGEYCAVHAGDWLQGHVACRYLSATPVPPRRAGEDGVPVDMRWTQARGLVLRATPSPQGELLSRLPLNAELRLLARGGEGEHAYCEVIWTLSAAPPLQGYTACRYLADTPLDEQRLATARTLGNGLNPDFDPRKAFDLRPGWDSYGRYLQALQSLCDGASSCAAQPARHAEHLAHMRRQLHGLLVEAREAAPVWPAWDELQAPQARAEDALMLYGETEGGTPGQRARALLAAMVLPVVAPSWFRDARELAGPGESLAALAQRFDAQQRWFVGALDQPGQPALADARIERLTRRLQRIELLADGSVRALTHTPQQINREWLPDVDFMCRNWPGPGYAHGDTEAVTRRRNGWEAPASTTPLRLFWFHSSRELPAGPARSERRLLKLDRARTGFSQVELRSFDLDADGQADLLWLQATGRAPGHIDGPLPHDDPWWRALLVNLDGRWRVLAVDAISYGCGC